jgi:hypothetical protein
MKGVSGGISKEENMAYLKVLYYFSTIKRRVTDKKQITKNGRLPGPLSNRVRAH